MSYMDALSRIATIQSQLAELAGSASSTAGASATSTAAATPAAGSSFASALAQASAGTGSVQSDSAYGSGLTLAGLSGGRVTGGAPLSTGSTGTLPGQASTLLTSDQRTFAQALAADTGLDPGVISAWLLAEENGGAATARQAAGNNDWLNIGYTDSGTYGAADSVWADPVTAANATAGWLKGQATIPGYGTASAGIQAILGTAGTSPQAQIAALQNSGWASSGYPDLPALYAQVTG